jgi:hypothetical protein
MGQALPSHAKGRAVGSLNDHSNHLLSALSFLRLSLLPVNCAPKLYYMKLKLYAAAALITMAALVSCGGTDKEVVDKSIIPTASDSAKKQATQNIANVALANTTVIPGTTTPVNMNPQMQAITSSPQNNVVMTPVQTPVQPTAPGMNPPHGQPGHRCDIPVGAPLNSKPAAAPTAVNAQPQVTMTEVPNKVKTPPGMNPPHGEPNHRCDIAVGAPLNSKPAVPATVTTTSAPASIAPPPLLTAAKSDSTKN